jgi:hypothetical protein
MNDKTEEGGLAQSLLNRFSTSVYAHTRLEPFRSAGRRIRDTMSALLISNLHVGLKSDRLLEPGSFCQLLLLF